MSEDKSKEDLPEPKRRRSVANQNSNGAGQAPWKSTARQNLKAKGAPQKHKGSDKNEQQKNPKRNKLDVGKGTPFFTLLEKLVLEENYLVI